MYCSAIWWQKSEAFSCQFDRPRLPVLPRQNREIREKTPKCTKTTNFAKLTF